MKQIYKIMSVFLILALIVSVYAAVQQLGFLATKTTKMTTKRTFCTVHSGNKSIN
jgi:hypothetical protein